MLQYDMTTKQQRAEIKRLLSLLGERSCYFFKLMYSNNDMDKDIDQVVDDLPAKKVAWALTQCQNTYYGLFDKLKNA